MALYLNNVATDALVLKHQAVSWCPGAKAPGRQYPQSWLNIYCIGPVSHKNVTISGNNMRKQYYILTKITQSFKG